MAGNITDNDDRFNSLLLHSSCLILLFCYWKFVSAMLIKIIS